MVVGLAIPFFYKVLEFTIFHPNLLEGGNVLTLGDLLALVDLGDLLIKKLVTLLADLDNLLALKAQS